MKYIYDLLYPLKKLTKMIIQVRTLKNSSVERGTAVTVFRTESIHVRTRFTLTHLLKCFFYWNLRGSKTAFVGPKREGGKN